MNADPKIISGAKAVFRSLGRLAAGMLLGAFVILTLAITSGFMLSHDRLNHVARNALEYGDLSFSAHTEEDYFTECGMLIMQYLRHDNVFLNSIDTRFIDPVEHPCQDLKALVAPAVSSQVKSQKPYSYPSYPFGSRYLEAWVLSFVELRDAKTLYALLSYVSVGILFLGAWRNSPLHLWSVLWICLFLLFGFSMHRFGHNLAHAPGFFVGCAALGFFLAARERFRNPANRIVFFGFLGILIAFFDLMHGSIPVVLSLSIVLNHLFYVRREAQPAAHRSPFSYLFFAIQQALMISVCFLVSYGVLTGLRILLLSNVIEGSWPHYIGQLRPRLGKVVPGGAVIDLSDVIQGLWVARFQLTRGGVVPATWMLFVSLAAWIFAICLLPVALWRQGSAAVFLLADIFVVAAAATGVLAWYWLFPNHTYIHTLFIVRIVALPASYGLVAATIVVRFLAAAGSGAIRWAFTGVGAVLAFVIAAYLLEGAWAIGMAPVVNAARFLERRAVDKVSCRPLGLTPDGKWDGLIEISLFPPNVLSPLALIGLRRRVHVPLYLLLVRWNPPGRWETGRNAYVLGMSNQAEGELINHVDGSIDMPTGHSARLYAHFCRDEHDTPDSLYILYAWNTALPVGRPQ